MFNYGKAHIILMVLIIGVILVSGCAGAGNDEGSEELDKKEDPKAEEKFEKKVEKEPEAKEEEKEDGEEKDSKEEAHEGELALQAGWEEVEPVECDHESLACFESLEDIEGRWINNEYDWVVLIKEDEIKEGFMFSSLSFRYEIEEKETMQGKAVLRTTEYGTDEALMEKKEDFWVEEGEKHLKISYIDDNTISILYEGTDEPMKLEYEE